MTYYIVVSKNEKWYYKDSAWLVTGIKSAKWYKRKANAEKVIARLGDGYKIIETDSFGNKK